MKRLVAIALLLILVGCAPQEGAGSAGPDKTPSPTEAIAQATSAPAETPAEATPVPVETALFRPGEPIILMQDDEELAEIVVDKVKQRTKYDGQYGDDVPAKGNVYIEMFVTYRALAENADYSSFDWDVFVDDLAIDGYAFVLYGPEPDLGSGNLPKGRKAAGWLVYEIPKTGRAVLSYGSNAFSDDPPVFEVLLRNK